MSRKRKPKSDKTKTVLSNDSSKTKPKSELTNFNIEFVPLVIDIEDGETLNGLVFEKLLAVLEEYSDHFGDDFTPKLDDYASWLKMYIDFAYYAAPWIYGVLLDSKPVGLIWACEWESTGYCCKIGGFAKRGTPIEVTKQTIQKLVGSIFDNSPAYIIRAECAATNRPARLAMRRAGFSSPEMQRAWKLVNGHEVTGIIKSITRPEWQEVLLNG